MRRLLTLIAVAGAVTCSFTIGHRSGEAANTKATLPSVPTIEAANLPGFDVANMDTSVSACANFFQYANGGWTAKNPIPAAF
jgi:putative endopeptidase